MAGLLLFLLQQLYYNDYVLEPSQWRTQESVGVKDRWGTVSFPLLKLFPTERQSDQARLARHA